MFEDTKNSNSKKEPEDIFAGVKEPTEFPKPLTRPAPPAPEQPPATPALSAEQVPESDRGRVGVPAKTVVPSDDTPPSSEQPSQVVMEEPKKSWVRLLILVVTAVIVVGAGTWIALQYSIFTPEPKKEAEKKEITDDELKVITPTPTIPEIKSPVDSDGDGLTDEEELLLGTDALLADSDADGLPDRDEVKVYKTDPLDSDTDKDGFFDGEEVQNGYDPKGQGKLYEVPLPGQE